MMSIALISKSQSKRLMDSLNADINSSINDTDKVNKIIHAYSEELWRYNSSEPYKLLKQGLALAKKTKFLSGEMRCYGHMLGYSRNNGNLAFAIKYGTEYLRLAKISGDSVAYARALTNIGANYRDLNLIDTAIILHLNALRIFKKYNVSKDLMARIYTQLGASYRSAKNPSLAILYIEKALKLREELNYGDGIDGSLSQLIGIYSVTKNYPKIIELTRVAIQNRIKDKDQIRAADYMSILGHAQAMMNNFDSSITCQQKAMSLVLKRNDVRLLPGYFQRLSESYEKKGDPLNSLLYYKLFKQYADSATNLEKIKSIGNLQVMFDVEEKENLIISLDNEKKIQEQDLKVQRYSLIIAASILLTVTLIAFFIFKAYKQKKTANILLAQQKHIIEEKNKEVMDSINYAKRLQSAILIPEQELLKYFTDIFVLFKPKDIVSGDFYWFSESKQNKIIAVADCTGHGVPGGFMSMLGYESLQDVALRESITTTGQALKSLDRKITEALNKSDKSFRDGMDAALCAFSKNERTLQYSGANRPLFQISGGVLIEHKPNKNTIGGDIDNSDKKYDTLNIEYKNGDLFYMFTDGYADQFGGPNGRKFMMKQLKELLISISLLPMKEQKEKLDIAIAQWKGNLEQVDDVCIIGIRV